jgi:hypothetical protein
MFILGHNAHDAFLDFAKIEFRQSFKKALQHSSTDTEKRKSNF